MQEQAGWVPQGSTGPGLWVASQLGPAWWLLHLRGCSRPAAPGLCLGLAAGGLWGCLPYCSCICFYFFLLEWEGSLIFEWEGQVIKEVKNLASPAQRGWWQEFQLHPVQAHGAGMSRRQASAAGPELRPQCWAWPHSPTPAHTGTQPRYAGAVWAQEQAPQLATRPRLPIFSQRMTKQGAGSVRWYIFHFL